MSGFDIKELLLNKKIYFATFLRLIVLPAIIVLTLKKLETSTEIMTMALISHTLSVITISLMYYLLIVI